eukprot:COSAG04_NODE_159_length_22103_cov_21.289389_5_plen_80_part_00
MSEDGDDRQFFPATVVIQGARLKEGHTAYYLLLCSTPAQQQWGVAKRFSEFSALRDTSAPPPRPTPREVQRNCCWRAGW